MKRIILCLRIYQFGQKNKVWWKCKYGHEWASTMNSRQKNLVALIVLDYFRL